MLFALSRKAQRILKQKSVTDMFFAFNTPKLADQAPENVLNFLQTDAISWSQLEQLLKAFRKIRPDLTVGAFLTFLFIARRSVASDNQSAPNLTISYIAEHLELSFQTAARHCDLLSEGLRGKPGLKWITKKPLQDQRSKAVSISTLGITMIADALSSITK